MYMETKFTWRARKYKAKFSGVLKKSYPAKKNLIQV